MRTLIEVRIRPRATTPRSRAHASILRDTGLADAARTVSTIVRCRPAAIPPSLQHTSCPDRSDPAGRRMITRFDGSLTQPLRAALVRAVLLIAYRLRIRTPRRIGWPARSVVRLGSRRTE